MDESRGWMNGGDGWIEWLMNRGLDEWRALMNLGIDESRELVNRGDWLIEGIDESSTRAYLLLNQDKINYIDDIFQIYFMLVWLRSLSYCYKYAIFKYIYKGIRVSESKDWMTHEIIVLCCVVVVYILSRIFKFVMYSGNCGLRSLQRPVIWPIASTSHGLELSLID